MLDKQSALVRTVSLLSISCFTVFASGCSAVPTPAGGQISTAAHRDDAEDLQLTITGNDGQTTSIEDSFANLLGPLTADLAPFDADGTTDTDPASLIAAQDSYVPLSDGTSLHLIRTGNTITSDDANAVADAASLTFSDDYLHVTLESTSRGTTVIDLAGPEADSAQVAKFLGTMAVLTLGGAGRMIDAQGSPYVVVIGTVIVVTLAISWVACIWGGSYECRQNAITTCGDGHVASYHQNCGVGYKDGLELGFTCDIVCK